MSYECEMHDQEAQPSAVIRTRTPVGGMPAVLGEAFAAIMQHLGAAGQMPVGPPFVAYHNMDMDDLDIEIGFPTATAVSGGGRIEAGEIPAGRVATVVHVGPYEELGTAYEALTAWVAERGYRAAGAVYEYYLNDPRESPDLPPQTRVVFVCEPA